MPVISTFNFDDLVATSGTAGDTNGVHRGFGSGVRKAPHWQAITLTQKFGDIGIEFTRSDK